MHNLTVMPHMKIYSSRSKIELLFDIYNQSYKEHNLSINFRMV